MSDSPAIHMDDLAIKVGGMFSLVTLINLRYRDLQNGAKPLINASLKNIKEVVLREINEDKISLITGETGDYELVYEDDDDFFLED